MTDSQPDRRFPCNACGSDLRFSPGSDLLECDHCGAKQAIDGAPEGASTTIKELDFNRATERELPADEVSEVITVSCENCGAQVAFEPNNTSTECPFCASPVVSDTKPKRQIKPRALLPFGLSETGARKNMTEWLGALWFAPNGLQEYARKGRRMQGIYVPFWTYDTDTKTRYSGQRGTVYYVTRQVQVMVDGKSRTRSEQVQKIRWAPVRGRVARFFDDVLVLGSKSLPKPYTDGLAPWDLSELVPYQPEYLAGFRAETYTVSLEDGWTEAREIINRTITRDVRFDIGGDRQQISSMDTDISQQTFKHILLPVWLAAYKYKGKTYRFVVNGRSGTVQGERPYSALKITLAVVIGLAIAGGIGYLIAMKG